MLTRLSNLYELQQLDDQLDELEELRGDLPLAVEGLKSQIREVEDKLNEKIQLKDESIEKQKHNENEAERLQENLKKFKAQLYQVRNNKEYDALTKEIDHCEDTIDRMEEENKQLEDLVETIKIEIEEVKPQAERLNEELKEKEADLKEIIKANEKEETKLRQEREKVAEKVRKQDYNNYMRIRKARHGKAVAIVSRGACSGCHNVVPPQRQIEIRQNKRMYLCESCGRILLSQGIEDEVNSDN